MEQVRNEKPEIPGRPGRHSIVLFAIGIMAIIAVLGIYRVQQERRITLNAAHQELAVFARALGTQIEAMVGDGVGAATAGAGAMHLQSLATQQQQVLQQMLTGGEYVRALFVIEDGQVTVANRDGESWGRDDLPDSAELEQAPHPVWIGQVREGDRGALILPVARKVPEPDGGVWAGAMLRISDLEAVYTALERSDTTVALTTLEGFGLLGLPLASGTIRNADVSQSAIYQAYVKAPARPITLLDNSNITTGEPRLYAVYRMQGIPAVASSGRDEADALQGWQRRTNTYTWFLALLFTVMLGFAVVLQQLYNRRWLHQHRLAIAQQAASNARQAELAARESLTRELLVAQERERARLASELHDGVAQNLSLLRNQALMLKHAGASDDTKQHIETLIDLASGSIEELRGITQNLKPMHLEELGLSNALNALAERVELSSGLAVHRRIHDLDDTLPGEAALHAYRIVQEAIHNVLRHAGASNLWIETSRAPDIVTLQIRDDGRGMPDAAPAGTRGLGLSSISERCAILGATLELEPNLPSGTILRVRIPLHAAVAASSREQHTQESVGTRQSIGTGEASS